MAYTPTNWQDYPNLSTAITAARLNNMETGIGNAYIQGTGTIVNADVAAAAAIAVSKLAAGTNTFVLTTTAGVPGWATPAVSYTHPPGTIEMYGAAVAPSGWQLCNGASLLRASFAGLFAIIGVSYGSVDGTHFTLPDMQGRVPVGLGTNASVNALNANDGQAVANRRPQHRTSLTDPQHSHNSAGSGHALAGAGSNIMANASAATDGDANFMRAASTGITIGSGVANDALDAPSYIVVNYIIKE